MTHPDPAPGDLPLTYESVPRTVRRIVREELQPLIELVTQLLDDRPAAPRVEQGDLTCEPDNSAHLSLPSLPR